MSIHKEVIVRSTSSHHVHPAVKTVVSKESVDTANIHSAINSGMSSSEREIQQLDSVVSYSRGKYSVCSMLGPSASIGVLAPYQNSALVDSDIVVRHQASPESQPLSREEEELLMNSLEILTRHLC